MTSQSVIPIFIWLLMSLKLLLRIVNIDYILCRHRNPLLSLQPKRQKFVRNRA